MQAAAYLARVAPELTFGDEVVPADDPYVRPAAPVRSLRPSPSWSRRGSRMWLACGPRRGVFYLPVTCPIQILLLAPCPTSSSFEPEMASPAITSALTNWFARTGSFVQSRPS